MPIAPSKQTITPEMFRRLVEIPPGDSVTCLIYGAAKTGKTEFMGSAGDRTLFLSNGNGDETLKSIHFKDRVGANPIVVTIADPIDPETGLPLEAVALEKMKDAVNHAMQNFPNDFDTICIDDSTALRRSAFWKGLLINDKTNKSKTLDSVRKEEVIFSTVQDYQIEMQIVMQFLVALIDMCKKHNKHLIVGAHERFTYRKGDKIGDLPTLVKVRPAYTGQTFPDDVASLFDCVFHSEVVGAGTNVAYRIRTVGDEVLLAGHRYGGTFETVEINLQFTKMIERIKNGQRPAKPSRK